MALPPWTVELLRRGVQDLARQATDPEMAASLKEQATKLVDELPRVAREKVDSLLKQAETSAQPLRDAWSRTEWAAGFATARDELSLTPTRLINGSGILLTPGGSGVAFSSAVEAAAIPFLTGDAGHPIDVNAALRQRIASGFDEGRSESEPLSAFVTSTFDGALAMVGALCQSGGSVWVPRQSAVAMPEGAGEGFLVDRLRPFVRGPVREFGSLDTQSPIEIKDVIGELPSRPSGSVRDSAIVHLASTPVATAGAHSRDRLPENWTRVVVIPAGSFFAGGGPCDSIPSIENELAGDADVVILAGGVLTGTPGLGIIVGKSASVRRMMQGGRASSMTAPLSHLAMVAAATVEQSSGPSQAKRLGEVSVDNLRDRAERLATQLTAAASVRAVRVADRPAHISTVDAITLPSRQVMITTDRSPESLARELAGGSGVTPIGLLTTPVENELAIDLRWVTPEQQARIGELFR